MYHTNQYANISRSDCAAPCESQNVQRSGASQIEAKIRNGSQSLWTGPWSKRRASVVIDTMLACPTY